MLHVGLQHGVDGPLHEVVDVALPPGPPQADAALAVLLRDELGRHRDSRLGPAAGGGGRRGQSSGGRRASRVSRERLEGAQRPSRGAHAPDNMTTASSSPPSSPPPPPSPSSPPPLLFPSACSPPPTLSCRRYPAVFRGTCLRGAECRR